MTFTQKISILIVTLALSLSGEIAYGVGCLFILGVASMDTSIQSLRRDPLAPFD